MRAKTSRRLNQQPTDSSARQAGLPDQQRTLANTATRPLQASTWQPDYSRQSRNISQSGHTGRGFNFANIAIVSPNNPVQAKLTIGQPNDKYEQEADRIAEQVVGMPDTAPAQPAAAGNNFIQRQENKEDEEEETLQTKPLIQRQMGNEEEEEEEETLQADSMPGASATTAPGISAGINALRGRGEPLAAETRHFMEPRFGQDFSQVRVHTGDHAAQLTRQINARAFTVGSDIAFGAGQYQPNSINGRRLLAHELTHTVQQNGAGLAHANQRNPKSTQSTASSLKFTPASDKSMQRRALTPAEETAAVASGRALFESLTIRVLQTITGVPAADRDGVIGPQTVRAISDWQTARGLTDNGIINQAGLDRLITDSLATSRPEHGIQLVIDFYNLNTTTDTLTVRHRTGASTFEGIRMVGMVPTPIFSPGSTTFEEGNLRVIEIGDPAFASATLLRDTIQRELGRVAPARGPAGATPARLSTAQARSAVAYTRAKYTDQRSVRAIQGLVGAPVTGVVDTTTVQFIAEAQHTAGIGVDGKVGIVTTENFYTQMIARGNPNSALRLLVDYFNMRDDGNLLSVYYDPTVTALASTDYRPSEPVRVRVGPNALTLPFSGAVHNIAHELEHVRRLKQGIVSANTHEFLGEAVEILSVGMPEEPLDPVNPHHDAFINDATRALNNWNLMPLADRRTFKSKFIAVRRKVLRRIDAGTAAQRAANAALRANYVAVVLP